MKNYKTIKNTVLAVCTFLTATESALYADEPNPWFGEAYSSDMTLIKLGAENGREILKAPNGKQVCLGKFYYQPNGKNYVRFGQVKGSKCNMTVGGANSVDLNGDDARLVHISKGGYWLTLNDAKSKGHIAPNKMLMKKEQSNPGYTDDGAGAYYIVHKGLWYAKDNKELSVLETDASKRIQVFIPGVKDGGSDAPSPWFGKAYSQDLFFVSLGGEKGREILKTPEGKQVCAAHLNDRQVVRFGHVDGKDCRIGAWGAQPIPLYSDSAKLVHIKKPGYWMSVAEAEQKQLISNNKALIKGKSSPSFMYGDNPGGSYFPSYNTTWFAKNENGQWAERSNNQKGNITIYIPNIPESKKPNPWFREAYSDKMTFIKKDKEKGRKILETPEGKQICIAYSNSRANGQNRDVIRFGNVDGTDCRIGAWGAQPISLMSDHARLVHVKDGGDWLKVDDAKNKGYVSGDKMMIKNIASPAFEPTKNATGGYDIKDKVIQFARNEGGTWKEGNFNKTNEIKMFVPGIAAPVAAKAAPAPVSAPVSTNTADAPNPLFNVPYKHVQFMRPGGENGRAVLKLDGQPHEVCAIMNKQGTAKDIKGASQLMFGHAVKNAAGKYDCFAAGWEGWKGYSFDKYHDATFLVHAPKGGVWKKFADVQDFSGAVIAVKKDPENPYNTGVSTQNGIPGKFHTDLKGHWGKEGGGKKDNVMIFFPGEKEAIVAAVSKVEAATPSNTADAPNPWFGEAYSSDMTLIKLNQENGREILQAPNGKQVCLGKFHYAPHNKNYVRFGQVEGSKCNMTVGGANSVDLNGDDARLVHISKGGSWLALNDAKSKGHIAPNKMLMTSEQSNPGYTDDGAGAYFIVHKGLWYAKDNKELSVLEADVSNKIQVFIPGEKEAIVAAVSKVEAAAPSNTADAPNPWFDKAYSQDLSFVSLNGENGRKILKTPDDKYQVCVAHFADKNVVRFGHVDGTNCMIGAWGAQPLSLTSDQAKLVHVKNPGKWMKVSEAEAQTLISSEQALITDKSSPSFIPGENNGGAYFPNANTTWYAKKGDNNQWSEQSNTVKGIIQIYVTGVKDDTAAVSKIEPETPVDTSEAPEQSDITQTAQGPMTEAKLIAAISAGRVAVEDPEIARQLESQKPISLDGESFKWVSFGKGFALQPVSLSQSSGVICRLFGPNGQAYIGNVYRHQIIERTRKDIVLSEIKVGEFVCRAGTDLQGNSVHITSKFQTLGSRGSHILWAPITSIQAAMWETGYKAINVGGDITEDGKTFKASGVCRREKERKPGKFHIGRAVVDQNNQPHCYLKESGGETDITAEGLQGVEIFLRPSLGQLR